MPCRRATNATLPPSASTSSNSAAFCAGLHLRRRVMISAPDTAPVSSNSSDIAHLTAIRCRPCAYGGSPEAADDRLRRVVGILRGALQRGVFLRDGGFECGTDLLPLRPERVLTRTAEAVLCQFRSAEADEAQQLRLLLPGRCAARLLQDLRQTDRGDVVARSCRPAASKLAIAAAKASLN